MSSNYDSNGPDVKIKGTASQVQDRYQSLARDAQLAGNRVAAENYLQHAEHYQRIINANAAAAAENNAPARANGAEGQPWNEGQPRGEGQTRNEGQARNEGQESKPNGRGRGRGRGAQRAAEVPANTTPEAPAENATAAATGAKDDEDKKDAPSNANA